MAHEDVLFYFGTCEAQALVVGTEEIIKIDGEFLARCFADTYNHLGCSGGPTLVGFVSSAAGNMRMGILAGIIAPVLLLAGIYALCQTKKASGN